MKNAEDGGIRKEELVRDDGRYVILFSFPSPDEPTEEASEGERPESS